MADNQVTEHVSGVQRFCNGLVCAVCISPLVLFAALGTLGWNERRDVCNSRAIHEGETETVSVGCSNGLDGNNELIMFSCDLKSEGLNALTAGGVFAAPIIASRTTGLEVRSEMRQCVENEQSETRKDNVGGGKTTTKTYTYNVQWQSKWIDSSKFRMRESDNFRNNCGVNNPSWPSDVPVSEKKYAESMEAGPFRLPGTYVKKVPLDTPVLASSIPAGWTLNGTTYYSNQWKLQNSIGQVRVVFSGNDWNRPMVTVLGQNNNGAIGPWIASDSWLCSGFDLWDLRMGVVSKDDLFEKLRTESSLLTVFLRFAGFFLAWFALSRMFGPLEIAADCVPCVGPYLGDCISCVTCCVSCVPAFACSILVIGVVWVVMRPMVGIPLIGVALLALTVFAYRTYRTKKDHAGGGADTHDESQC